MGDPGVIDRELASVRVKAERGELNTVITAVQTMLNSASRFNDYQVAELHELLARCQLCADRKPDAMQSFRIASGLFEEAGATERALYCSLITISTDPAARSDGSMDRRVEEAYFQARNHGWRNLECLCSLFMSDFTAETGNLPEAIKLCMTAIELGDAYRLQWENHTMFLRLGRLHAAAGDLVPAVDAVRKAFDMVQQASLPWAQRNVLFFLSYLAWMQRDFIECIRCSQVILDSVDQSSRCVAVEGLRLFHAYRNIGQSYLHLGDYDRARDYMLKALEFSRQYGVTDHLSRCYSTLALIKLLRHDPVAAVEDARKSLRLISENAVDAEVRSIQYIFAIALLARGGLAEAADAWSNRIEKPDSLEFKVELELFHRALGLVVAGRYAGIGEEGIETARCWLAELSGTD